MKGVYIKFRNKNSTVELPKGYYRKDFLQLVGYDDNGKEVYEDDELVDEDGNTYRVVLTAMFINDKNGFIAFNLPAANINISKLTLKGE